MTPRNAEKKKARDFSRAFCSISISAIKTDELPYGRLWVAGTMMQVGLVPTLLGV
jgi:hypothetical protein